MKLISNPLPLFFNSKFQMGYTSYDGLQEPPKDICVYGVHPSTSEGQMNDMITKTRAIVMKIKA